MISCIVLLIAFTSGCFRNPTQKELFDALELLETKKKICQNIGKSLNLDNYEYEHEQYFKNLRNYGRKNQ